MYVIQIQSYARFIAHSINQIGFTRVPRKRSTLPIYTLYSVYSGESGTEGNRGANANIISTDGWNYGHVKSKLECTRILRKCFLSEILVRTIHKIKKYAYWAHIIGSAVNVERAMTKVCLYICILPSQIAFFLSFYSFSCSIVKSCWAFFFIASNNDGVYTASIIFVQVCSDLRHVILIVWPPVPHTKIHIRTTTPKYRATINDPNKISIRHLVGVDQLNRLFIII